MGISTWLYKTIGTRLGLPSPQGTQVGGRIAYPDKVGYISNCDHGYNKNPVVAACVGLYASTMNEPPLGVARDDGTVDTNHPLSLLFRRPNQYMGQADFWQCVWTYLAISGNCYLRKNRSLQGNIVELIPYSDAFVAPQLDALGWVNGYVYRSNNITETWKADEVIHLRNPVYRDPMRMYMGISPIEVAWDKINTYNELQATMYSLVASNAVPSGVLSAPSSIDATTLSSLKRQLEKRRTAEGRDRTEPLVLGSGMTYTQMGLDSTKLQANEMLQELEVAICSAFRIHPVVALTSAGLARSTYNNIQSAYQEYTTLTRVPFWNAIEEQLESGLQKEYPAIQLQFDMTEVQALQPDPDSFIYPVVAEWTANIVTLNETRKKLGFEPVEDGDKYAYQVMPTSLSLGTMSAPATQPTPSPVQKQSTVDDVIESVLTEDGVTRIKWVEAEAVKYYEQQNDITEEYVQATIADAVAFLDNARKQALAKFKSQDVKAKKPELRLDELVKKFMTANEKKQAKLFKQILDLAVKNAGGNLADVQSDIDDIRSEQAKDVNSRMTESGKTLQRELNKLFEDNRNASDSKIAELIEKKFDSITQSRANTIARTVGKAQSSVVQNHTMKSLNKGIENNADRFVNVWLSQRDSDVRDSHERLDGQWAEIGESFDKFVVGVGEGPGLGSLPEESINCRCTLRPTRKSLLGK